MPTVSELRELCKKNKVSGYSGKRKSWLLKHCGSKPATRKSSSGRKPARKPARKSARKSARKPAAPKPAGHKRKSAASLLRASRPISRKRASRKTTEPHEMYLPVICDECGHFGQDCECPM